MCANFVIGLCERGKQCLFAHSPKEIRSRPCLNKTKMCPNGESCDRKDTCLFAHEREELVSTNEFTKTKLCHFGQRCLQKENCRYAHTLGELRKVKRKNITKSESNSNDNNNNFYDVFEMIDGTGTSSSTVSQNKMFSGRKSNTAKRSYSENESQDTLPSGAFQAIKMAYAQMRQQELLSQQAASINFNSCDNQTRAAIAASMGIRSIHISNNDTNDNIKYMNMMNYQQQQQQPLSSSQLVPFQLQQSPYNNHNEEIIKNTINNSNSLINKNSFNDDMGNNSINDNLINKNSFSGNNSINDNLINKNGYNLSFRPSNIQNSNHNSNNNNLSIQTSQILQSYNNKLDENQSNPSANKNAYNNNDDNDNIIITRISNNNNAVRISANSNDDNDNILKASSSISLQSSSLVDYKSSISFQSFNNNKDDENYNKFLNPSDILRQSRRINNNAFNSSCRSESSCNPAFSRDAQRILTETLLNAQPERYED